MTSSSPTETPQIDPNNQNATARARLPTKASRQRFKPQLSCTLCRARKLKCDRNTPCQNCSKRDLASSCTYIHAGLRDIPFSANKASFGSSSQKDVRGRVRHLEELVVTLMHQSALKDPQLAVDWSNIPGPDAESMKFKPIREHSAERNDLRETSDSFGRISIEGEQPNYVGASHWAAILDSIAGLKGSLDDNQRPQEPQEVAPSTTQGPELLVGSVPKATKSEILAGFPPRSVVDLLVERFYETPEFSPNIHIPTFKREYENFWANPIATPVMWIGLIYAMLCLSLNVEVLYKGQAISLSSQALRDPHEVLRIFRERTVQCLILGNYTEPTNYTVETLLLYFFTEHFRNSDSHVGAWMATGLLVRAAMRLGYHRDARHSPNVSMLRGEMQRRIWASIVHMDIQTSCRVGLPRMVKEGMFDTEPPRNLLDEDFDVNTKVLPPSRPFDEATTNTYPLIKHAVMRMYGMIVDQTSSIDPVPYDEIMRLDALLHDANQQTPGFLKVRRLEDLKTGSPEMIIRKFSVNLCHQRARCVLHRRYLVPSKSNLSRHWYSVKTCVDAAMQILQSQSFIYEESKPNRMLYIHKWKTTSLMTHDFLLAAMLICVYLHQSISSPSSEAGVDGTSIRWSRDEMLGALDGSYRIWDEASHTSKDALKAANALMRTLSKARGTEPKMAASQPSQDQSPISQISTRGLDGTSFSGTPSTPLDAGVISSSISEVAGDSSWMSNFAIPSAEQGTFETMVNGPLELDWELWDNHFHNNLCGTPPDLWSFNDAAAGIFSNLDSSNNIMEWGH